MTPITWNATGIAVGVRDIRGKWVNSPYYRNGSVEWSPLSPLFLRDGNGWQTSNSPVLVRAPQLATQPIQFVNGVAWSVHAATSIAAAQNELLVSHPNASPVEGIVLEGRESQVLYRDAIMDGVDLAVGVWHGRGPRAEHVYVIRRMPSGDSEFVEIESLVTAVGSRVAGWDGASLLEIGNTSIVDRQDDRRGWTLRPAVAWYYDATGNMVSTPIVARMQYLSRGNVKVTKLVPRLLIATALAARENGELRCDLTGTFYPDADPETTTHDAYTRLSGATSSWSTIRSTANATITSDSTVNIPTEIRTSTTASMWNAMRRGQYGFDLSSLSGQTVDAVDFSLFGYAASTVSLSGQSYSIAQTTPAIWTQVSLSDYGSIQRTKFSTDTALSSVSIGAENIHSLNSSGIAAIQAAVGSKIMLSQQISSDMDDLEPTWGSNLTAMCQHCSAETAGTSSDPRLVVTYGGEGGGGGGAEYGCSGLSGTSGVVS